MRKHWSKVLSFLDRVSGAEEFYNESHANNQRVLNRLQDQASLQDLLTPEEYQLVTAINTKDLQTARALLNHGVNPNLDLPSNSLLHLAVCAEIDWESADPEPVTETIVADLLAAGADPFVVNAMGTPLDIAKGTGNSPKGYLHPIAYELLHKAMKKEVERDSTADT